MYREGRMVGSGGAHNDNIFVDVESEYHVNLQGFIEPHESPPPNVRQPPSPDQRLPIQHRSHPAKDPENERENGQNINLPLRFLFGNFKIVSKISNLNWFFAETRKNFPLGF